MSHTRDNLTPTGRYRYQMCLDVAYDMAAYRACPGCGRPWVRAADPPTTLCGSCEADQGDAEAERGLR